MPSLTLVNSATNPVNRPMSDIIKIEEPFLINEGVFTGNNANLSISSGTLAVTSTSAGGCAYAHLTIVPYTVYNYSVQLVANSAGDGKIAIGVGVGQTDYIDVTADTNGTTYTGTFTPTAAGNLATFSLITNNNGRTLKWDDAKIWEDF